METKDIIKTGRQRIGMTHQAFANAVGVSRGAVQQWEKGDTAPTRKHQPQVAEILGVSVSELMGQGQVTPPETDQEDQQREMSFIRHVHMLHSQLDAAIAHAKKSSIQELRDMDFMSDSSPYMQQLLALYREHMAVSRR